MVRSGECFEFSSTITSSDAHDIFTATQYISHVNPKSFAPPSAGSGPSDLIRSLRPFTLPFEGLRKNTCSRGDAHPRGMSTDDEVDGKKKPRQKSDETCARRSYDVKNTSAGRFCSSLSTFIFLDFDFFRTGPTGFQLSGFIIKHHVLDLIDVAGTDREQCTSDTVMIY